MSEMTPVPPESDHEILLQVRTGLRALEERFRLMDEEEENAEDQIEDDQEGEGQKALRIAISELLRSPAVGQAINTVSQAITDLARVPNAWMDLKSKEASDHKELSVSGLRWNTLFAGFVLLVLATLAWNGKFSKEVAAGLIGSLIGYWYGRERPKG